MSEEKKELIERLECNPFGFMIKWSYLSHWCNVEVFKDDQNRDNELTTNINEAQVYLEGYIKWDGCSELRMPQTPHWCGPVYYKAHITLLEHLYKKAMELTGNQSDW